VLPRWWRGHGRKDTPSNPKSSGEEEEEGEVTPPPLSLPRETLPPFSDIISQQVGVTVGVCQPKQTRQRPGRRLACLSNPILHRYLLTKRGSSVVPVLIEPTHLLGISQDLPCSSAITVAMVMTGGLPC
jgi:hypothetical protein